MNKSPIYTIGHGNRKSEDFLVLLQKFNIDYVVDVRSQPYSKFNPHFNQFDLKVYLSENRIRYVFMGDVLGGRPLDKSCYDIDGKVDYSIVKTRKFFADGLSRLKVAYEKNIRIAIMCSESKPIECHRSKLIGRALFQEGIVLMHIDEAGLVKDQVSVINELNKGKPEVDLFGNNLSYTSRNAYL